MAFKNQKQRKAVMAKLRSQKKAASFVVKNIATPLALTVTFKKSERLKIKKNAKLIVKDLDREIKQLQKQKVKK